MFYRIDAEHVRNKKELIRKLANKRIEVMGYGEDPTFDSMFVLVIVGSRKNAEAARKVVWEHNFGASCEISELTADEYDEMC